MWLRRERILLLERRNISTLVLWDDWLPAGIRNRLLVLCSLILPSRLYLWLLRPVISTKVLLSWVLKQRLHGRRLISCSHQILLHIILLHILLRQRRILLNNSLNVLAWLNISSHSILITFRSILLIRANRGNSDSV